MSMDVDVVKKAVREVLAERASVSPDVHSEQHEFLTEAIPLLRDFLAYRAVRMEQIKRRDALWTVARNSAIGIVTVSIVGAIISVLAWLGALVIQTAIHAIQHGSGTGQ